jgi:hypothetical protein
MRVLEFKTEAASGTPESLTTAAGVVNAFETKIEPTIPATEREGQSNLSPLAPVPGTRQGKATFKSELVGSGLVATDPYWAIHLLTCCGFPITSHTANPLSGTAATATIGGFLAGRFLSLAGAMGKFNLICETGKPAMFDWEFDGVWQPPTSVALPAPAYPPVIPPRVANCTFTLGSLIYAVPKVEISVDNTLYMREDITQVSGYAAACITARKITVKVAPEALPLATQDWYAAHLASTGLALNLAIGGATAGNSFTITAPNLVLLNPPGYEDRSGLLADSLEFLACRSTSLGDDELQIAIG